MKYSDVPAKFQIAFGASAGVGFIRAIPQASQIGIHDGWASLPDGFPPLNFLPIGSGGVPPFGQDMNGILNQITLWSRWQNAGGMVEFDSTFATAVGGYPQGAVLRAVTLNGFWYSLRDDNASNPDTSLNPLQDGWLFYGGNTSLQANGNLFVNGATGNDTWDGSAATHTIGTNIGPFATLQKAADVTATYAPGQFTLTINVADGTYAGVTFHPWAQPPVILKGNSGTPTNVIISASNQHAITAYGNGINLTVQDMQLQASGTATFPPNFSGCHLMFVGNGASVMTAGKIVCNGTPGAPAFGVHSAASLNLGNFDTQGSYSSILSADSNGSLYASGITIRRTGNLTVSTAYVACNLGSITSIGSTFTTVSGTITGINYSVTLNGVINTQGGGATYFPGTNTPNVATGGQYA